MRQATTHPKRPQDDEALDEAIKESFPASDPPANTVETGVSLPPPPAPSAPDDDEDDRQ
jgi:hypothetical protein